MIVQDFCMKFASEEEAMSVLYTEHAAVTDDSGSVVSTSYLTQNFELIDEIGLIYEAAIFEDPEDPQPLTAIPGWHVNVRVVNGSENTDSIEPFVVFPENPRRTWG